MYFCTFQEVMFVSRKYAIFTSPATSRKLSRFQLWSGTPPCWCESWLTAFAFSVACGLILATSGCGSGVKVTSSGVLGITPDTVDFGIVPVGYTVNNSVNVVNESRAPVVISQMSFAGGTYSATSADALPITIPAGGRHTLVIGFTPIAASDYSGLLTLEDMSASSIAKIPLHGQGALNGNLSVSASNLSFGSVTVNSATTQVLALTSTGTSPVTVNSVSIAGTGFTIVGGSFPVTLNPTQSMTLQVQFLPTSAGAATGQINISDDSNTGSMAVVALSGMGTAAAPPLADPQLTVSASNLSFGSVKVNSATTQVITLTSTGTSPVTVNLGSINGGGFTIVGGSLPATLNPGQTVMLQVQFLPTTVGAATGQITINSNSITGSTAVVALSGMGMAAAPPPADPQLSVTTSNLGFGNVKVNSATTQVITLTSTGTSPVTVNSASVTGKGFTIAGGSFPMTLNPTQSVALQVQFLPTSAGAATGQITISSNSITGSTTIVALSGTGSTAANPQLSISAVSLSFGSATVNSAATQVLTLTSTGTSPVTVYSASIAGAGFTIVAGSFPVTLNPTQSAAVQVQFLPTSAGAAAGQIIINSGSTGGGTTSVALNGTGTTATNPQLSVGATSLSFGSVTVSSATTQVITLTSTGTSAVTVNSVSIKGVGFSIVAGSFPATLNPSQSMTLQIQFLPTSAGTATGQITISSNSTNGSAAVVILSGTAIAANPQLTVSATNLSFGSVTVSNAITQSVTLTSTGTSPVTVNSASITGADFSILGGSFPLTLNPTQSATLQVQFLPTSVGSVTGQIAISSNSTNGSMATVTLSGTGVAGIHSVSLSWDPPSSSPDPVVGYNIYRSIGSSGPFQLINSSPDAQTKYVDSTVVSGNTYNYYAKSVDASGIESTQSNEIAVSIP
jgi:hypothetical protein